MPRKPPALSPDTLRVHDVAPMLGRSPAGVYRAVARGHIPPGVWRRVGRDLLFSRARLTAWLDAGGTTGQGNAAPRAAA